MDSNRFYKSVFSFGMILIFLVFIAISKLILIRQTDPSPQYFPVPKALIHFTFGYQEVMADVFWLRLLQDFDYCEKKNESGSCVAKGWVFKVLDLTCDLAPTFLQPHSWGALALSVLVGDIEGAAIIFSRAIERFPKNSSIPFWAGYHAFYEERNPGKAARYLEQAGRNGAPSWVYALATRLYTEAGQKQLAEGMISNLDNSGLDPALIKRMKENLKQH